MPASPIPTRVSRICYLGNEDETSVLSDMMPRGTRGSERGSEQTMLGEGIGLTVADDEVIKDSDVDEGKGLL